MLQNCKTEALLEETYSEDALFVPQLGALSHPFLVRVPLLK